MEINIFHLRNILTFFLVSFNHSEWYYTILCDIICLSVPQVARASLICHRRAICTRILPNTSLYQRISRKYICVLWQTIARVRVKFRTAIYKKITVINQQVQITWWIFLFDAWITRMYRVPNWSRCQRAKLLERSGSQSCHRENHLMIVCKFCAILYSL